MLFSSMMIYGIGAGKGDCLRSCDESCITSTAKQSGDILQIRSRDRIKLKDGSCLDDDIVVGIRDCTHDQTKDQLKDQKKDGSCQLTT